MVACQSWYPATLGLVSRYPFRTRTVVLGNRYWGGPEVGPDQYLTLWSRFRCVEKRADVVMAADAYAKAVISISSVGGQGQPVTADSETDQRAPSL